MPLCYYSPAKALLNRGEKIMLKLTTFKAINSVINSAINMIFVIAVAASACTRSILHIASHRHALALNNNKAQADRGRISKNIKFHSTSYNTELFGKNGFC